MITMEIIEMLYFRFATIWGDRFTAKHTPILIEMWYEEWLDGLQGLNPSTFRDALKYCKNNLEWSPSIAEFIRICDRSLNIPSPRECMDLAIRGNFSHTIIKSIHDKIGSFDMRNLSTKELIKLFTEYHFEEMVKFRRSRSNAAREPLKAIEGTSHGSEISRDNTGGNGVQKAEGYLF